jgi:hypothetical protein
MQPDTIDVTGLPGQVVADIQKLVQSIRNNLAPGNGQPKAPTSAVPLPRWDGTVLSSLTCRELYDDVG